MLNSPSVQNTLISLPNRENKEGLDYYDLLFHESYKTKIPGFYTGDRYLIPTITY